MTREPDTRMIGYRQLNEQERAARLRVALEMRRDGKPLEALAEVLGCSRGWACKLMKAHGVPVADVIIDKRGSTRTQHGRRHEPEYYSWYSMKTRRGNPNHADYPNWGGRGITYDPAWESFANFYADMGRVLST